MSETATKPTSVYARLNAVKAEVSRIPKNGFNQHFQFKFSTESDIIDVVRPLCAKHGVALVYHGPDLDRMVIEDGGTTKSGTKQMLYRLWVRYEVVNVDDPADRFEVWGYGEGLDTSDKGHSKALTNAHKYVIIRLFDVSTGDPTEDPDAHGSPGDERPSPVTSKNAAKTQAALDKGKANQNSEEAKAFEDRLRALGKSVSDMRAWLVESKRVNKPAIIEGPYMGWPDWVKDVAWDGIKRAEAAATPLPKPEPPLEPAVPPEEEVPF